MPDRVDTECVVCGTAAHSVVVPDDGNGRQTVRCATCKLIYVLPPWTAETARRTFAEQSQWPGGLSPQNITNRQPGLQFIARQIAAHKPTGGALLDVGCADGKFFDAMRQTAGGWEYYGAEPDVKWDGLDYKGAQVTFRQLRECHFPDKQFDVVTILDALYYLPDPDQEMAELARILKPGGLMVFDVAGLGYLQLRGMIGGVFGMDRTRTFAAYPFYHSMRSVSMLLEKAGFAIDASLIDQGIEHSSALLRLAMPAYLMMVKALSLVAGSAQELAPKIVYVARRL